MQQLAGWHARLPRSEHAALQRAFVIGLGKKMGKSASSTWYASAGSALFEGFAKGVGTALALLAVLAILALVCRSGRCAGLAVAGLRSATSSPASLLLQRDFATTMTEPRSTTNTMTENMM